MKTLQEMLHELWEHKFLTFFNSKSDTIFHKKKTTVSQTVDVICHQQFRTREILTGQLSVKL